MTAIAVRAYAPALDSGRAALADEIRRLREEARSRTSEVDLLVAALKDHIRDLQAERDHLRAELSRTTERARLDSADWLHRGLKGPRD